MMSFLKPDYLWNLLWIMPALVFFSALAYNRRKKQLEMVLGGRAGNPKFSTLSPGKRMLRNILLGTAVIFMVLAAARPSWGTKILPYSGKGRDLLIVLDVSKSMMSQDVQPSRLGHAKWFLRELIKECPGDRFGIVAFAGTAFLQCPMTADKTTLFQSIDEMSVDSIPLGGTNIQQAIETSIQAFKAAEGGHRAIILLTDGDEIQGSSSAALEDLKKMKIPMFVVGIGDPSQPGLIMLPGKDGKDPQFLRDSSGELVKSPLNETQLKKLAGETSGIYVRSTATSTGLSAIQKRVKSLVPEKYDQGNQTRAIERFHIPLLAAVLLLLAFFAVNERRKAPLIALLLISANFAIGADNSAIPLTDDAAAAKTVQPAMPDKNSSLSLNPEQPAKGSNYEIYNQALELQKKKEFEKASALYENAISKADADPELISKACQNLGVIKHESARTLISSKPEDALKILDSAEDMYRESMRALPQAKEVALNQQKLIQDRETAKKMLEQKKQMEQKKQEAQKKTKEAHDSQQKENQQKEDQQKQGGKDQKQNKDQQQQQNSQNKQDDAQKKTDEAQKAVEDYKQEAQKQDSKESEQSASKAEKEIEKAKEEQKKGNGEKAEENLKNAMKELGESEKNDKNKGDEKKEQDKPKQDQGEKNPEKQNGKPQNGQPKDDKEIDPSQAESLLDLMANDEKKLRDEIKEYQRKDSGIRKVDKDW
ncbi:MAG: VWA domain-containing protein [Victivallales bacterium]|jgi:Ca-activated chloride channel family protein